VVLLGLIAWRSGLCAHLNNPAGGWFGNILLVAGFVVGGGWQMVIQGRMLPENCGLARRVRSGPIWSRLSLGASRPVRPESTWPRRGVVIVLRTGSF
jgi:hypothetical protein